MKYTNEDIKLAANTIRCLAADEVEQAKSGHPGVALGIVTGGVLLLHARILPLDHYELAFVTPLTSVVMFGLAGLLLGVLFAFVLRNNPSQVKRAIYLAIVCILVSWLYSWGFVFNVVASLAAFMVENIGAEAAGSVAQEVLGAIALQLGDVFVFLFLDVLLCGGIFF